jgi:hypothetical protein
MLPDHLFDDVVRRAAARGALRPLALDLMGPRLLARVAAAAAAHDSTLGGGGCGGEGGDGEEGGVGDVGAHGCVAAGGTSL